MQKKILELLTKTDGYVSGSEISEQLGVSRQAVWKAINGIKEQGYKIDSVTNRGYRLVAYPPHLNEPAIEKYLKTSVIGKNLIVLDEVGSTNDYLKKLGADGCENGTVAVAREQTQGKGRLGRVWKAKKDDSITFSFLLRPKIAPSEVSSITPLAGLAVCKAIREFTGLDCRIKWPNDIIIGKKKLVGILTEMSAEFDAVEYVITGIGINADTQDFPDDIKEKATSIYLATGGHFDKNKFFACVLNHIEEEFIKNDLKLSPVALKEYTSLCATIGRDITFTKDRKSVAAKAVGVSPDGELIAELPDTTTKLINSGEVTVQGIY